MKLDKARSKTGNRVEKMELALKYAKNIKTYSLEKICSITHCSSRRVTVQVSVEKLIG